MLFSSVFVLFSAKQMMNLIEDDGLEWVFTFKMKIIQ